MFARSFLVATALLSLSPALAFAAEPSQDPSGLVGPAEPPAAEPRQERAEPMGALLGFDADKQADPAPDARPQTAQRPRKERHRPSMTDRARQAPKIAQADRLVFY